MSSLKKSTSRWMRILKTQAALLHNDIPGYDLPTIDFVQTTTDNDEDVSKLEEDNSQIYAHLDNVFVHMIDNQETAIFKSNQIKRKSCNILNMQKIGKSHQSYVLIQQWHVMYYLL